MGIFYLVHVVRVIKLIVYVVTLFLEMIICRNKENKIKHKPKYATIYYLNIKSGIPILSDIKSCKRMSSVLEMRTNKLNNL